VQRLVGVDDPPPLSRFVDTDTPLSWFSVLGMCGDPLATRRSGLSPGAASERQRRALVAEHVRRRCGVDPTEGGAATTTDRPARRLVLRVAVTAPVTGDRLTLQL